MGYKNSYYDEVKEHHTTHGFCNQDKEISISYKDIRKWKKERHVLPPKGGYAEFNKNWYKEADFTALTDNGIWWLGHATALININQKIILTDPVFSQRVSPVPFAGPKRFTDCASAIDKLPQIDIIVISHNHYDHLDHASITGLIKRFPQVTLMVPLGLKSKMVSWGAKQVIELDWWQKANVDGVVLSAVPAKHWSRRSLNDTNKTLWCGWMIEYHARCIYFVGDTGYTTQFVEIKQHFPSIDIALIPIGSYAPRWFMQNQHIDPQQAIQLFKDVGCKRAIAIHWGAFELADEPLDEPPQLLKQLLATHGISEDDFLVIKIGDHIDI